VSIIYTCKVSTDVR